MLTLGACRVMAVRSSPRACLLPVCPGQVPCDAGGAPLLALSGCALRLPQSDLGLLHLVRNPLDIVVSAYWFHSQLPAPEEWLENGEVG